MLFLLNAYPLTIFYGPYSLHIWRQADCLSITKNYFEGGMHFFSPEIHSLRAPGGRAVSEFPIINYTVAMLWQIFGEHEFIYKLLEYLIYLASVFVLFNTLLKYFQSKWYVFFVLSLLLTSPLLVYYSFNFLSDVPALAFGIIAFCFLYSFYKTKQISYFYFSVIFGTLATLLKASAVLPLLILCFFSIIDLLQLNRFFGIEKLLPRKVLPVLAIVISVTLIFMWYSFARAYNSFNNGVFLLTIVPIWEMSTPEIFNNLKSLFNNLFPTFLNRPMLALFFMTQLYIVSHFSRLNVFLKYVYVFSLVYFLVYILGFFQVFTVHDYYLVNLFIFPVICFFSVLCILDYQPADTPRSIKVTIVILFIFNAFYAAGNYRVKMVEKDSLVDWYPFISREEINGFEYAMWDYKNALQPVKDVKPVLRQFGVKRDDIVLSLTDGGPNVALYLMDQKGYVLAREVLARDSLCLTSLLPRNVKYMVLNNAGIKNDISFKKVAGHFESIYTNEPVEIFKRK